MSVPDPPPPPESDPGALDELFEALLEASERGDEPELAALSARHDPQEVEHLWELAQDVSAVRAERPPSVPGYEVLAELGRGGMGRVYLAREQQLGGRAVALKLLPPSAAMSRSLRGRFRAEASLVAGLRHRHVITVHRVLDRGPVSGFAMEWIDGGSLARLIELGGPSLRTRQGSFSVSFLDALDPEWSAGGYFAYICRVGRALADALASVHAAGLLHRDVKPSNVLLRSTGEPVLSDFGLVRELGSALHTRTGQFVGTAAYAPPEQLRGELDRIDQRSDVYSLGATLFHAVTGGLPWPGVPVWKLSERIETAGPPGVGRAMPAAPSDLAAVIAHAMRAEPDARYPNAGAMAEDLDRILADRPVLARRPSFGRRAAKFIRRHRRPLAGAVGGGAAALLAALAGVAWFVIVPRWSDHELRLAREQVMNFYPNQGIVTRVYWNPERLVSRTPGGTVSAERRDQTERALAHYRRAASLAQGRRERTLEARAMATSLTLMRAESNYAREADQWGDVPIIARYLRRLGEHGSVDPGTLRAELRTGEDPLVARTLGLIALMVLDYDSAVLAWTRYDRQMETDPVVEAMLGELYLVVGEPALAYPRLRAGLDAFPDTRSLNVSLAEAAAQLGDSARAERLLERAERLPLPDPYGRFDRIRAMLLLAEGRGDEAEALYRALLTSDEGARRENPITIDQYATLLWNTGRREEALRTWAFAFRQWRGVDQLMRRYVTHLDAWVADLAAPELERRLVGAALSDAELDPAFPWRGAPDELTLDQLLWIDAQFRDELARRPARLDEVWRDVEPTDWAGDSVSRRLGDLMRLDDRGFWRRVRGAPSEARERLARAWASGEAGAIDRAERALPDAAMPGG